MEEDKQIERKRYDSRAERLLSNQECESGVLLGSQMMPVYLRDPYLVRPE